MQVSMENTNHQQLPDCYKSIKNLEERISIAKTNGNRQEEGEIYSNLGRAYQFLGQYNKAIEYHEKSQSIAKEIGDRQGEGNAYGNLGIAYNFTGKYHKAIEYHEKMLTISKEFDDKRGEGSSYGNLGISYNSLGEYHKAIEYHERSLRIAKEIGDIENEGHAHGNLGNAYHALGEYRKAKEYHEKSLSIAKEIGNRQGEGISYGNLGNVYLLLGEYHKAIEYHEKNLKNAKEIGCRHGEGFSCQNLGNTYRYLGEYHKAIEYNERSLSIATEIGDRKGQGNSYENLGNAYRSLGEYYKAIEYHEKRLIIAREIGDKEGEGSSYGNLGITYQSLGEYHKAIEYNERCLSIAKEIGNRYREGSSYGNLGNAYASLGEFHKAIKYHERSLGISKEIGNSRGEGSSYGNLGNAYRSLGEYHKAIEYHEQSLSIAKEIGSRQGEGSSYGLLGNAYASLGEYHKAIEYFEEQLSIAKDIGDRWGEAVSHHSFGICFKADSRLKDVNKAEDHLHMSIECYENLFDDLKDRDQFKISFVDTYVKTYKVLIEVLLQKNQPEKALLICERGRARALRDLLNMKYKTSGILTSKQKCMELDDVMTISSNCGSCLLFYDMNLSEQAARFWVIASSKSIFVYNEENQCKELEKLKSDLHKDDLENTGSDDFENLVENSFKSMGVREGMTCEDRSLGELEREDLDRISSRPISKPSDTPSRCIYMDEENEEPLEMLFDRLISPVLNKLTQEEIVIIPDGPLFTVPFAALQDPQTHKFLSETKRLRLAPSLSTLKLLQESSHEQHHKSGALIIGDPAVGQVMYRGIKRDIYPLQGAMIEALEIGELLGVEPLIREQATKEAILTRLQHGVSVIHFAAHGCAKNGEIFLAPSQPLTDETIPEEKDYMLTMKEVQESGSRAQLVVLSCCHSGRGEIKSEGIVGMSRAFLAAGARAVVASLWAIADQATRFFMVKFYSHLKKGESASRSLQKAMKEMRETEMYKEPKYWAAFFLIGDDVTISGFTDYKEGAQKEDSNTSQRNEGHDSVIDDSV